MYVYCCCCCSDSSSLYCDVRYVNRKTVERARPSRWLSLFQSSSISNVYLSKRFVSQLIRRSRRRHLHVQLEHANKQIYCIDQADGQDENLHSSDRGEAIIIIRLICSCVGDDFLSVDVCLICCSLTAVEQCAKREGENLFETIAWCSFLFIVSSSSSSSSEEQKNSPIIFTLTIAREREKERRGGICLLVSSSYSLAAKHTLMHCPFWLIIIRLVFRLLSFVDMQVRPRGRLISHFSLVL